MSLLFLDSLPINTTKCSNTIEAIDIIKDLVIVFLIIKIDSPWNTPSTSLNAAFNVDGLFLELNPAILLVHYRISESLFLGLHQDFHSLTMKRERLGKVSYIKRVFLVFECVLNLEIEPLLMAFRVSIYV